jgi:AcrR family transcriptional regulator
MESASRRIPTLVKDEVLVREKRGRIVSAAVELFVSKGFHSTTTREIAAAAAVSIGSLYEYVESKEDVLYLVCESIHGEIESQLREVLARSDAQSAPGGDDFVSRLQGAIAGYFRVCDRMQDSILLIYRETASLNEESRRYVLRNEARITGIFRELLREGSAGGLATDDPQELELMAHNVVVLGHMWCLRRWSLRSEFSIDAYIEHQTALLMREILVDGSRMTHTLGAE